MIRTVAATVVAVALAASPARADVVAITGAKVHTAPGATVDGATVVMRDGKITAVSAKAKPPAGATIIDGTGLVITAGFVESMTTVGMVEVGAVSATVEGNFGGTGAESVHAAYRVTDGYNPSSVTIPIARTGGITAVVAIPRGGLIAGTSAWISLADAVDVAEVAVVAPAAMYAQLGAGAMGAAGGNRGGAVGMLREVFDDVDQYARNKRAFDRNQTRAYAAGRLDLEALVPVLRGRVPLVVSAHRASDILAAVRLAVDLKLRLVIAGGTEAWRVADELAAANVPVILDPTENLPSEFERAHVRDDNAARLRKAGVTVAISRLGDGANARTVRQLAGVAVAHGLSWDDALAAVTTAPAAIFGVRDRGTIAVGNAADIVVWSGDPFELSSRPLRVYIGGVEQSLETHQSQLLRRYRKL